MPTFSEIIIGFKMIAKIGKMLVWIVYTCTKNKSININCYIIYDRSQKI